MKDTLPVNHTFAVCAYKESPYLEKCLSSVVNQKEKSNVIICTPTPNEYIKGIAEKYNVKLFVNPDSNSDMQGSWNFAMTCAETDYVTICHQDDYYSEKYYQEVKSSLKSDLLYLHTGYSDVIESKGQSIVKVSKNALFKRMIHLFFANNWQSNKIFFKKWDLRFGNSVCCPTCTYNKSNLTHPVFTSKLTHGVDWDLYINMACRQGRVTYVRKQLVYKRTHLEAQTLTDIQTGVRKKEDILLYSRMWPKPIAKVFQMLLTKFYYLK